MIVDEHDRKALRADELASRHTSLAPLLRKAQAYAQLNRRLVADLNEAERQGIRIACVQDQCLVIAAASPAWASRARVLAPRLLDRAAALWPSPLVHWKVVVTPGLGSPH